MQVTFQYEISIYDYDNDLIERYVIENDSPELLEQEKQKILDEHYFKDEEATFCTVTRMEIQNEALFKYR